LTSTSTSTHRRCAWKNDDGTQCPGDARPGGSRGPRPHWCEAHAKARKRAISHHPAKPRAELYAGCPACISRGRLCDQHYQFRKDRWAKPGYLDEQETEFLTGVLDLSPANLGFSIDPRWLPKEWRSHAGPDEGRTFEDIWNTPPWHDPESAAFCRDHPRWWKYSSNADWPSLWDEPEPVSGILEDLGWKEADLNAWIARMKLGGELFLYLNGRVHYGSACSVAVANRQRFQSRANRADIQRPR
jgi:hypothetical protein